MDVVLAGCGLVGAGVAEALSKAKHGVTVVEEREDAFDHLGHDFRGSRVLGCAYDEDTLRRAGARGADVFVAVTGAEKANIAAALVARDVFGVRAVVTRLYAHPLGRTLSGLGIDKFCGTELVAAEIARLVSSSEGRRLMFEREDSGLRFMEVTVPPETDGMTVSELNSGTAMRPVALIRACGALEAGPNLRANTGDRVVIVALGGQWHELFDDPGILHRAGAYHAEGNHHAKRIVIGGSGSVGVLLASLLAGAGYQASVIDEGRDGSGRLKGNGMVEFVEGTICDEETLVSAGIREASAFAAVTGRDSENLMAVEVVKTLFGGRRVVARLSELRMEATFKALATGYVNETRVLSRSIIRYVNRCDDRLESSRALRGCDLVEFKTPPRWEGREIASLTQSTGYAITHVVRGRSVMLADGDIVLKPNDTVGAIIGGDAPLSRGDWKKTKGK